MNCGECPFKNQIKVYGEGSRITGEHIEEIQAPSGFKLKKVVQERDSTGQYDVVCVGMAPAKEEEKEERPFVGASGQILRKTFSQMDIEEFYACNVLLCPIIDDELANEAIDCCRDVREEVLERKPKLIIALGDLPFRKLRTSEFEGYTIKEVEGRIIPSNIGIPLLPITHPAYYWRRPDETFDFIECLRSGIRFLDGSYRQAVNPTYEVATPENYTDILNKLDRYPEIAVDSETTGLSAYGYQPDEMLEIGLAVNGEHAYIVPKDMVLEFKDLLEEKKCIFWNGPFDCGFLKQAGINPNFFFDGMLAHYTIDERPYGHGLKKVGRIYLGCDDWEKDIRNYIGTKKESINYSNIPTDKRYEYLSKDVTRTFQLREVLWNDVNWKVFDKLLMPGARMFIEIVHKGMRINPYKMLQLDEVMTQDLNELEVEIRKEAKRWINPNSPKDVAALVYDELKLPMNYKLGRSTSKAYLEQFRTMPIIDNILTFRQLSKNKGTYLEGFAKHVDRNFRIHPNINLGKTVTGRLSSDEPSIMNIKSDSRIKSNFLPDQGEVLGYGDIKQNEVRWYYVYTGDEDIGAILKAIPTPENPRANDPHYRVSVIAYGEELADTLRGPAKAVVFGRMYKRGRASIEMQVGSNVIDALMDTVDGLFPNIENYYKNIMKEVKSKGYLESFFGRRRRFILITQENAHKVEREAINFPIQSAGSDLMLLNMLHLWEEKERLGIWPFWPVHDSITFNMKDRNMLPIIKKELESYSREIVEGKINFDWDMDWGYDWSMQKEEEYILS